jgi:hypothetical protein
MSRSRTQIRRLRLRRSRNNPSRGWAKIAPRKGRERHTMYKMNKNCFLKPPESFPVCRRGSRKPDCRGILAAYRRAKQYGYYGVAKKAKRLARSRKCSWVH